MLVLENFVVVCLCVGSRKLCSGMQLRATGVSAAMLSSTVEYDVNASVFRDLRAMVNGFAPPPGSNGPPRLLCVTPERITKSGALLSLFDSLYSAGLLRRIVIDEVCGKIYSFFLDIFFGCLSCGFVIYNCDFFCHFFDSILISKIIIILFSLQI